MTSPDSAVPSFADRLAGAIDRAGTTACVGLDPVLGRLPAGVAPGAPPAERLSAFTRGVLGAVAGVVPVVKFQSACYERYGPAGLAALHQGLSEARELGLVTILDAKRGDIGVTAEHYAAAAFDGPAGADALTVSAYMGADTLEPYLAHRGRGIFVLVRTSNPGSDQVQNRTLESGAGTVAEMMGDLVREIGAPRTGAYGLSDVGAVVAATKPADAAAMRRRMPSTFFLIPGYGAQGGTIEDVRTLVRAGATSPGHAGVLVTASRSVIYPDAAGCTDWTAAIHAAARRLVDELRPLV